VPLKVPGSNVTPISGESRPSETDLWMALATMKDLGKFEPQEVNPALAPAPKVKRR
jgi:hypothetical protein